MMLSNFDPINNEPLNIIVNTKEVLDGPPYVTVKMTDEGIIVDFYQNGECVATWARTYTELWEESL